MVSANKGNGISSTNGTSEYDKYVEWATTHGKAALSKTDWLESRIEDLERELERVLRRLSEAETNIRLLDGWDEES